MSSSKITSTLCRSKWEESDFPKLCQTCIGDNTYIRMMKERYSKGCRTCGRHFTVNRWFPGACSRFKATEVCRPCAVTRNICQTCLHHMNNTLDVTATGEAVLRKNETPENDTVKRSRRQRKSGASKDSVTWRTPPSARGADQPGVCRLWLKNKCKGACSYRHERAAEPEDPGTPTASTSSNPSSPDPPLDSSY